jgi:hypothetical protein
MRKVILAMQMSLDGFIEGPNGGGDGLACWQQIRLERNIPRP